MRNRDRNKASVVCVREWGKEDADAHREAVALNRMACYSMTMRFVNPEWDRKEWALDREFREARGNGVGVRMT